MGDADRGPFDEALGTFGAGNKQEALRQVQKLLEADPRHADGLRLLGLIASQDGRHDIAVQAFGRALQLSEGRPFDYQNLGIALSALGRTDEAAANYRRAIALKPDYADAHNNLGIVLMSENREDEAMAQFERAIGAVPDHAESHNNLGVLLRNRGRFDEAMVHYGRAIAIKPDYAEAHFHRAEIEAFHSGDAHLMQLEALAAADASSPDHAMYFHFALAKALDDIGDYARAFDQMAKGNALKRSRIHYAEAKELGLFRRISAVFDGALIDRFQGAGDHSSVPIFVLGMPRSGSSLVEQILASHPEILGAGERPDLNRSIQGTLNSAGRTSPFPECVPALDRDTLRRIGRSYVEGLPALTGGKTRIVDKTPGNFFSIGLIRMILPNAKIIHTVRDPADTCLSCYSRLFASGVEFSYDLKELGRYYRSYRDLMAHWNRALPPGAMLEVSYEDVVNDLEGQARRLTDFCGLPWDERCIAFHGTQRQVRTASSVQVRKPLYRTSVGRWRHYEAGLAPLLGELNENPQP